ncbi:FAD-dependent oxidoreductase [Psychromarinibacter sp. C21-152]|uniref:FAD-dependent oxidoreductase n=1 Tax=Psychromarinibacter sediminicola TaxID=3033385 RepID=A0AAE3NY76_9RHOB|nr:FAD-dependent oxidoreductase [Psychromarinibacter sediminicola]MDF0603839.1 FAD-dependent oxidoreductase [Psychromarinibacter sediminicola]
MNTHYRAVVIGGGVVGASVLYHLAKAGWTDIALIERDVLTAGSSWHAAGGIHALNADPNMAALQAYTIDLLSEIEAESGQDIGLTMSGGITFACDPDRWEWLQAAHRVYQSIGIDDTHLLSPREIADLHPLIDIAGVKGGLWADREGYVDPSGVVHAYARCARQRGADVIEHNRVLDLNRTPEDWQVVTEKGTIHARHVVNAAGLWAKQVGRMAGLELPVSPLSHHYLLTETIPEVAALDKPFPMAVDLEGFTYSRQHQKGMLLGIYEIDHAHWMMDGAPWDYGIELLQEDPDRIERELTMAFERFPVLQTAGIKDWVHGAFTFSPDGNPLVGPVDGVPGYWCACGVMAGFLQGGGVGRTLAEWMTEGETEADAWSMDIARYGPFASNKEYIRQTTGQFYSRRFVMTYPNEQLPAGRPLKMSPAHSEMTQAGARWGVSYGLEIPLYFAPKDFTETPSLRRSNAHPIVGAEARAVRETAGLLDIAGFSRYEVTGPGAPAYLDRLLACRLPEPGRAALAPMLAGSGRLRGDLTVFNWGDGRYWLMGSYYLRSWHMRWFHEQWTDGVMIEDISEEFIGFSLSGPNATAILDKLTDGPAALPFLGCGVMDVGLLRGHVARLSVTGELGYEISVRASGHIALRRALLEAGAGLGLVEFGYNALNALRLEKSFGAWNAEYTQDRTPAMVGLDRFICWDKDFLGHDAALAEREAGGPARRLVTLEVDAAGADASGYEPVWSGDRLTGFVTSGGYGHRLDMSLALALVDGADAAPGTELRVHVVGEERAARVIEPSPYDPAGKAMRG